MNLAEKAKNTADSCRRRRADEEQARAAHGKQQHEKAVKAEIDAIVHEVENVSQTGQYSFSATNEENPKNCLYSSSRLTQAVMIGVEAYLKSEGFTTRHIPGIKDRLLITWGSPQKLD